MTLRLITICWTITVFTLLWPQPISGRPLSPSLEMLTKASTLIVVAHVEEVKQQQDMLVATARVLEVWKGTSPEKLYFRASKSWVCDSSHAVVGETVVLFLGGDPRTVMGISYSGMGRLPVNNADGRQMVLYGDRVPKELKRQINVAPESPGGMVELKILKRYVKQLLELKRRLRPEIPVNWKHARELHAQQ